MGFFLTLVLLAASILLSELLKPKVNNENARPTDLGDFNFPTATEGRPVPIVFGTVKLSGPNVIWYGDLRPQAITNKVKTGLFSSKRIVVGFRYRLGIQMAMCRGPIGSLLRIFVDDEELWSGNQNTDGTISINKPDFFGGEDNGSGGIVGNVSVRLGSNTQTAPSYLTTHQSVGGQTPNYNGTAFVLLERVLLGTSTSIRPWAFEVRRIPNGLSLTSGEAAINSGNDANPMNVLFEILTNTEWGLGLPSTDIDTAKFAAAAAVLAAEGNGISMVIDSPREVSDLINEIQRQIDGVVFLNRATGLWDVKLARADFTVGTLPLIDSSNLIEMSDFSRGSWAETQNIVNVQFTAREREYQTTYATAQDMANMRIQGNQIVKSELRFPGVKNSNLANQIAWRELRVGSTPLARARLVVNREFYAVNPGDPVRWTDADLGFSDLVMRVVRADFGELTANRITLDLVQDLFSTVVPSFASPSAGDWTPALNTMVDIASVDRKLFEAPRAFTDRDPSLPGVWPRIWAGFRGQSGAVSTRLVLTSDQTELGSVAGFLLVGELGSALAPAYATNGTLVFAASPDTKAEILASLASATQADIGVALSNLILIGNEFLAFTGVSDPGGNNIQLNGLIRGLLDSAPPIDGHSIGERVWLIHIAGGLTDSSFPGSSSVTLRPLPESTTDRLLFASATNSVVSIDNRHQRPYPPINPRAQGTSLFNTAFTFSVDTGSAVPGTGNNGRGIALTAIRRDFRQSNEVSKLLDETSLPADFPSANTTEYRLVVRDGSNTLLYTDDWQSTIPGVSRNRVLAGNAGVLPASLRVTCETRHTVDATVFTSLQNMAFACNINSGLLSGLTALGALATNVVSTLWTAPGTGTYNCGIDDALPTGALQVRINGGSWTDVITGVATTGTFSATAGDDLEFRHTATATPDQFRFASLTPPSGTAAYAVLVI